MVVSGTNRNRESVTEELKYFIIDPVQEQHMAGSMSGSVCLQVFCMWFVKKNDSSQEIKKADTDTSIVHKGHK